MRRTLVRLCTLAIGLACLPARAQWVNGAAAWQAQGVVAAGGGASVSLTCTVPLVCTPSPITGTGVLSFLGALPNGTTATTQSQSDASTKVATTAYVDTGLGTKMSATGHATSLTDGVATLFATVTMASGSTWGGKIFFKLEGKDATDFVGLFGQLEVFAIDKAGTITCTVGTPITTTSLGTGGATSTLTAFTCADAGANVLNLLCNYTTSLTDSAGWPKLYHLPLSTDTAVYTPQ